jgi:calcium uniporter protein, mitochondrial
MRHGADQSPVERAESDASAVKNGEQDQFRKEGKVLTTPSRMLKLIIPLGKVVEESSGDEKGEDVEPLALLVHPQQPLSYLERLIQSELPPLRDKQGHERMPRINFRAPDSADSGEEEGEEGGKGGPKKNKEKVSVEDVENEKKDSKDLEEADTMVIKGKRVQTGKLKSAASSDEESKTVEAVPPVNGGKENTNKTAKPPSTTPEDTKKETSKPNKDSSSSFSLPDPGPRTASSDPSTFVRWSSSTEVGDFIRDAARAKHFALDIEGLQAPILVGVPSFQDRTYYLRMRLRQKSREIERFADLKRECDQIAERGAKQVAIAGGAALVVYWFIVYMLTFRTELGWDVMEPITVSFFMNMTVCLKAEC